MEATLQFTTLGKLELLLKNMYNLGPQAIQFSAPNITFSFILTNFKLDIPMIGICTTPQSDFIPYKNTRSQHSTNLFSERYERNELQ